MPITCPPRPIFKESLAENSPSGARSSGCRTCSARFSTRGPISSAMARSSIACSMMATPSRSVRWRVARFTSPATRLPTWPLSSATLHSWGTRCSCRTSAPRGPISRAAMRDNCSARSAACSNCRARREFSCAMITRRPDATNMHGKPPSASSAMKMCM